MKQSQKMSRQIINHLEQKIWEKITQRQVIKMVPTNIEKMNDYTFQTLIQQNTNFYFKMNKFSLISDKISLRRDNFLKNHLQVQKLQKTQNARGRERIQTKLHKTNSKIGTVQDTSKSLASSNKLRESKINKLVQINYNGMNQIQVQRNKYGITKQEQIHQTIDMLRNKIIYIEEVNKNQIQKLKQIQRRNAEKLQNLQKKKKQVTKFSFDYNGQFFGINKTLNPQNMSNKIAKLNLQQKELIKLERNSLNNIRPQLTQIVHEKTLKKLKTPSFQFSQFQNLNKGKQIYRFIDSFEYDNQLQEGVSIKQESTNFQRKKPLIRTDQKISMPNFKKVIVNTRFKQFKIKSNSNAHKNLEKYNLLSERSKQHQFKDKTIQKANKSEILNKQKSSEIKKVKFKTMNSQQSQFWNNKTKLSRGIQFRNRLKDRGVIRISNQSLYGSMCVDQQ